MSKERCKNTTAVITGERNKLEEDLVYPEAHDPISLFWLLRSLDGARPISSIIVNDVLSMRADPCSVMSLESSSSYVASNACVDGYAAAAGLGVQMSAPDNVVIALTTDESLMQTPEVLWSVAHYRLPLKIVVVNAGGAAKLINPQLDPNQGFPFDKPAVQFTELASAMHLPNASISNLGELDNALMAMFESEGPYLLDVKVTE